jgi:acyl-CoA oxidase
VIFPNSFSDFAACCREFAAGKFDLLPAAHASSSGLKGYTTTIAADGIEEARRACGGHGYSQSSGLPQIYQTFTHVQTAEGENYLLTQQTTRHLLKVAQAIMTGTTASVHPHDPAVYLSVPSHPLISCSTSCHFHIHFFSFCFLC